MPGPFSGRCMGFWRTTPARPKPNVDLRYGSAIVSAVMARLGPAGPADRRRRGTHERQRLATPAGAMKEGTVVPVIGPRLLIDADGAPLTARVARRLLADYDVEIGDGSLPPFRELTDVATWLKGKLRNPQDLYGDVDSAFKTLGMLEPGESRPGPEECSGRDPEASAAAGPNLRLSRDGDVDARRHARAGAEGCEADDPRGRALAKAAHQRGA